MDPLRQRRPHAFSLPIGPVHHLFSRPFAARVGVLEIIEELLGLGGFLAGLFQGLERVRS